jgi:hypothetical protein
LQEIAIRLCLLMWPELERKPWLTHADAWCDCEPTYTKFAKTSEDKRTHFCAVVCSVDESKRTLEEPCMQLCAVYSWIHKSFMYSRSSSQVTRNRKRRCIGLVVMACDAKSLPNQGALPCSNIHILLVSSPFKLNPTGNRFCS